MIAPLLAFALAMAGPPQCSVNEQAMLKLGYDAFDETPGAGWRVLGNNPACIEAAANLIASYRQANAAILVEETPENIRSLNWHEGQLLAAAGQTVAAKLLLKRGSRQSDTYGDSLYHAATLAFLNNDKPRLLAIRDKINGLPKPDNYEETMKRARAAGMNPNPWPVHAGEVSGFVNCFGKSYAEAYSVSCRDKSLQPAN